MIFFKSEKRAQQADIKQSRRFTPMQYLAAVGALLLSVSVIAYAATITSFTSGQSASAAAVNTNFSNLNDAVVSVQGQLLGVGQTWQDFTVTRFAGVDYTNNTTRPINVSVKVSTGGGPLGASLLVSGIEVSMHSSADFTGVARVSGIVPPGAVYRVNVTSGIVSATAGSWVELR